jgi:hypothetical protein
MAELGWIASEVMQDHLQNLVSQAYTAVVDVMTCACPRIPHPPFRWGGCVMACTEFYEWGFGVPSHPFLYSLLQFYGLELHHLIPSEILHKAAFVTLCEAYMVIELHFNMWNYFLCARLQQSLGTETADLGNVDIFVRSGPEVDPYFHLSMSDPSVG